MLKLIKHVTLMSLVLGLMCCAREQPAKSPAAATPASEDGDSQDDKAATPPAKAEKESNDGSGSASPLPE